MVRSSKLLLREWKKSCLFLPNAQQENRALVPLIFEAALFSLLLTASKMLPTLMRDIRQMWQWPGRGVVPGLLVYMLVSFAAVAVEPPVVPIGLDAIRRWDQWPYQRIGVRTYMRSTYDRRGGNEL